MSRGKFIVFEGLDGAGTSTQLYLLRDYLLTKDIRVEVSQEPTNGPIGGAIRLAIEGRARLDPRSLALAFAADRADHLFNEYNGVLPTLESGRWVISDRYVLSALAYQGAQLGDFDWLESINNFALTPDLTVYVDTSVDTCASRFSLRSSHEELFHEKGKLRKVAAAFARATRYGRFTGTLIVADGEKPAAEVFDSIRPAVDALMA